MRKYSLIALLALAACEDPTGPRTPRVRSDTVEARALWVSRFEYASAQDIGRIFADAKSANFNIIYLQVRGNSDALYNSNVDPCAVRLCGVLGGATMPWDPLATALGQGSATGIQVHAWINAFIGFNNCADLKPSAPGKPNHILVDHPEWVQVNASGQAMACDALEVDGNTWVSPGIPGVRTRLARVAADIARYYPTISGVHLDFIRYPGSTWGYDTTSLRVFGKTPASDTAAWAQFRRDQVTAAVREVDDSLAAAKPSAVLSAAVWGIYRRIWSGASNGYGQFYQDPRAWANAGTLDVANPMAYWPINATYCGYTDWLCLLDDHVLGFKSSGRHVYIGMLADDADEILKQIDRGRDRGAQGFTMFSYGSVKSTGLFPRLAEGPFRLPARVPTMSWK